MFQTRDNSTSIDWVACAQVEVDAQKLGGTPVLKGSRMPADAIVQNYASGLPAEEIADVFQLPADGVRLLLAYAKEHQPALQQ